MATKSRTIESTCPVSRLFPDCRYHRHKLTAQVDFFDGKPADIAWYPPDNKEKEEKLGKFFSTQAAPPKTLERVPKVIDEIKTKKPSIKEWAAVGFCWGGKVVNLLSGQTTPFKAAAVAHPAMVDPEDAKNVTIPYMLLASKDEDKEAVGKWEKSITTKHYVETFPDQIHGWMAARSDLKDPKVKAE